MQVIINNFLNKRSLDECGFFLFLLGIFFLPSAVAIGILFLFPAFLIGSFIQKKAYLKDSWNFPFLIFGFFLIFSSIFHNFLLNNNYYAMWDPSLSLIGLGNWLPFIWVFWAAQPFLNSTSKRRSFALVLIFGTLPVLITGFGQYFLRWTGPLETLNGLIIWYLKPLETQGGLSGLFNNQNYTGSWLNIVWPFCLALALDRGDNFFRKTFIYSFLVTTGLATVLTFSRSAWLGLITSIPFVTGRKGVLFLLQITILLLVIIILVLTISPNFMRNLQSDLRAFMEKILLEFSSDGYDETIYPSRLSLYKSAFNSIKESPIFGTGAASFTEKFQKETNFWVGHSHNLLIELSISYGIPSAILFFSSISKILLISWKTIFFNNKNFIISTFDKAFWSATCFFLLSQLVDIQYFDGKISIICWVLIAGLKDIIEES